MLAIVLGQGHNRVLTRGFALWASDVSLRVLWNGGSVFDWSQHRHNGCACGGHDMVVRAHRHDGSQQRREVLQSLQRQTAQQENLIRHQQQLH